MITNRTQPGPSPGFGDPPNIVSTSLVNRGGLRAEEEEDVSPDAGNVEGVHGPTNYNIFLSESDTVHLSHLVTNASNYRYNDPGLWFKVRTFLNTQTVLNDVSTPSCKVIEFNLSARRGDGNLPRTVAGTPLYVGALKVNQALQTDIRSAASKNAALPGSFETMDLRAVVERLAKGVAKFAMFGTLTGNELRGGGNLNVRSIHAANDNIVISGKNVFLSKTMSIATHPAADYALVNAICGEGATPYTDLLELDANGVVRVSAYHGIDLAQGCYRALVMIGAMYNSCGDGASYALAIARGMYSVVTLAGHSDEGGYIRTIFRAGAYPTPYGAVLYGSTLPRYTGLPCPGPTVASFRNLVFSIVIGVGGGSAVSDPLVYDDQGRAYPTILTAGNPRNNEDPGAASNPDTWNEAMQNEMQRKFADNSSRWCANYAYYISKLFGLSGSTFKAAKTLEAMCLNAVAVNDDHLRRPVIVPYYFVEPTGSVPFWDVSLPAYVHNLGPLATPDRNGRLLPAFTGGVKDVRSAGHCTQFSVDFRYARRHPILVHLEGHILDGLAALKLWSGGRDNWFNVGGEGDFHARLEQNLGLDAFMWGRLHNSLVAPGELCTYDQRVLLCQVHETCDADRPYRCTPVHGLSRYDLSTSLPMVRFTVGGLSAEFETNPLVHPGRGWQRARSGAALALSQMRLLSAGLPDVLGGNMRPIIGELRITSGVFVSTAVTERLDMGRGRNEEQGDDNPDDPGEQFDEGGTPEVITNADHTPAEAEVQNANIVPYVVHNRADRGRRQANRPQAANAGAIEVLNAGVREQQNVQVVPQVDEDGNMIIIEEPPRPAPRLPRGQGRPAPPEV